MGPLGATGTFTGSKWAGYRDDAVIVACSGPLLRMQIWLSVCSLYVVSVLSLFNYLLSQSPTHPPLCIQLFVPATFVDCLFISGPGAASVPEYEIAMVIVIFYDGDKGVKTIGSTLGSYRRLDPVWLTPWALQPCNRGYTGASPLERPTEQFPVTSDLSPSNIVESDI